MKLFVRRDTPFLGGAVLDGCYCAPYSTPHRRYPLLSCLDLSHIWELHLTSHLMMKISVHSMHMDDSILHLWHNSISEAWSEMWTISIVTSLAEDIAAK